MHRDESPLDPIGICACFIALVPFKVAGERLLGNNPRSETQVDWIRLKVEDGVIHDVSVTM